MIGKRPNKKNNNNGITAAPPNGRERVDTVRYRRYHCRSEEDGRRSSTRAEEKTTKTSAQGTRGQGEDPAGEPSHRRRVPSGTGERESRADEPPPRWRMTPPPKSLGAPGGEVITTNPRPGKAKTKDDSHLGVEPSAMGTQRGPRGGGAEGTNLRLGR